MPGRAFPIAKSGEMGYEIKMKKNPVNPGNPVLLDNSTKLEVLLVAFNRKFITTY